MIMISFLFSKFYLLVSFFFKLKLKQIFIFIYINITKNLIMMLLKRKKEKKHCLRMKNFLLKNVLSRYNVSIPSSI